MLIQRQYSKLILLVQQATMFSLMKKQKEAVSDFPQGTEKIL